MRPSHDSDPLITICVTAYRRPTMAVQSLLACVAQDYRPLEIDVSDDSPNDDSERAILSIPVPDGVSLRYRRNQPSLGEAQNVNSLFREARGKYSLLMHDDDVLLPGAVTALSNALEAAPNAIVAFGIQEVISNSGEVNLEESSKLNAFYRREKHFAGVINDPVLCALRRQLPNNGYLVRTEAARAVPFREHNEIGRAGDTDFAIRLAQRFSERTFIFVSQPVSQYRLTDGSSRTMTGMARKLYDHLAQLPDLTPAHSEARQELMQRLAYTALIDNAVCGNRQRALSILLSRPYRSQASLRRKLYHLSLIAFPHAYRMKRYVRPG